MRTISLIVASAVLCCVSMQVRAQNLVPKPVSVEHGTGEFFLDPGVRINYTSSDLAPLVLYLGEYLPGCRTVGVGGYSTWSHSGGAIYLELDPAMGLPAEGYRLSVSEDRVTIRGVDYSAVWNGIQTFLQLLPPKVYDRTRNFRWTIPEVSIEDYPRMAYRGVMLDVARTFMPKEDVLRLIDNISRHKINKLHWHLADDEGWRIEIKGYPRLHETGGFRGGDSPVKAVYGRWDERYGGYYTQDDIHRIVAYAAVRGVEIIPEIDLPGHSRAAAIAYPEILCDYTPDLAVSASYDTRDMWCVAREENYAMLSGVIAEVAALFPSEYIHLGGDEVSSSSWTKCPHCKALMAARGITDPASLQDVFMERVIAIAASHGKKAGVWNEAAASGRIARSTLVWGWESVAEARKVAAAGYPTIVCPGKYFYFDMRQSQNEVGHIWAGIVSPETVYSFDFAREGFTAAETAMVSGVEATFFSELLLENGLDFLDYQLFPRVCALAEVAWTPRVARLWSDFERRLTGGHFARLDAMGIKYRRSEGVRVPMGERRYIQESARQAERLGKELKTPSVVFTSSIGESSRSPFDGVESYRAAATTSRACVEGDWFLWRFREPVVVRTIFVKTGYDHLQRAGVPQGKVEVSYDGHTFETAARLHDLKATLTFEGERPIRALRIVSESHGNGERFVIVQPLKIR